MDPYDGESVSADEPGITGGNSASGLGVNGKSPGGVGVRGESDTGRGVEGFSKQWQGVFGHSIANAGVVGDSEGGDGVYGDTHAPGFAGVSGRNMLPQGGNGVLGTSDVGRGVGGFSRTWQGVYGHSEINAGVVGESEQLDGVFGVSKSPEHAGVSGHNDVGGWAGWFGAKVYIATDLTVMGHISLGGADCAEEFDVSDGGAVDVGTVMVLDRDGALRESSVPYDRRVAGVVSGAGEYRPGIVLDRQPLVSNRALIALMGKAYCKVDAENGPIMAGDLLTTSPTPGCAMSASDSTRAFGSVIGKALQSWTSGRGLIPILVTLH